VTPQPDRLYELLPAVYRMRDAQAGEPLRALLQVIAEQIEVVQGDIERLYDNWFIETCEDWVVPYIGDLVGELPLVAFHDLGSPDSEENRRRLHAASPRRQVAGAIGRRRRKGTPAVLEELVNDLAGWPACVVESFRLLQVQQAINHLHLDRGRTVDVADMGALDALGTPFDTIARTLDLARIGSRRSRSRWSIPAVAVFAYRLRPHAHTRVEAFCFDSKRRHYTFSVLGNDAPLMAAPLPEPGVTHIAQEPNLPAFITRRALRDRAPELYGPGRSLRIWRDAIDRPVPVHDIVAADLSAWAYRPLPGEVAVDPQLGRIAFSPRNAPEDGVWVTFNEGFPDEIGGGEYPREQSPPGSRAYYAVRAGEDAGHATIMEAFAAFAADREAVRGPLDAVIEILDGGVYQERIEIELAPGDRLELRAADGVRPVIRLLDLHANRPDQMRVRGVPGPRRRTAGPCADAPPTLVLDGLLITGRSVQVVGAIGEVVVRHCTLVPGWSLEHDCRPAHESEPSIELDDTSARLRVEHSIVGSILVDVSEVTVEPLQISLTDSVLDAAGADADALGGPEGAHAHAYLTVVRTTVLGRVLTHAVTLGEGSIFDAELRVARRQVGCLRYCHVPAGSRAPRQHRCQPELVRTAARELAAKQALTNAQRDELVAAETLRVAPLFDSIRYGTPTYARVALSCAAEIARGADDGGEMGVYHDLFHPQREDAVRRALDDFTPAGMAAGILFAT
jgi:hypothetical protein